MGVAAPGVPPGGDVDALLGQGLHRDRLLAHEVEDGVGNAVHTALSFPLVGQDVLITGAGPIGIMAAAICRHAGARRVVITDVNDYRLNLAVITSYSIHYTKLYDYILTNWFDIANTAPEGQIPASVKISFYAGVITSYSIHYTK